MTKHGPVLQENLDGGDSRCSLNLKVKCSSKDSRLRSHDGHCGETGSFQAYLIYISFLDACFKGSLGNLT